MTNKHRKNGPHHKSLDKHKTKAYLDTTFYLPGCLIRKMDNSRHRKFYRRLEIGPTHWGWEAKTATT